MHSYNRVNHNYYIYKVVLFYFIIKSCFGHFDPAYMRHYDDGFKVRKTWMSEICDDVQLSELALPGTHASGSFDDVGGFRVWLKTAIKGAGIGLITGKAALSLVKGATLGIYTVIKIDIQTNQCLHFKNQLDFGIRVFDIGIWHHNDKFILVERQHRELKVTFDQFLFTVIHFLSENPSETVLIILSKQKESSENNQSYGYVLNQYLNIFNGDQFFLKAKNGNISLGEARGKFIFIEKDLEFVEFGLNYYETNFDVMESCYIASNWHLYHKKWELVKAHLQKAVNGKKETFYLNYLNGFGGSFPYFVVSGRSSSSSAAPRLSTGLTTLVAPNVYPDFPRTACLFKLCTISFEGTNILSRDKIGAYNTENLQRSERSVGIIITDFPGDSLIETIIKNNKLCAVKMLVQ